MFPEENTTFKLISYKKAPKEVKAKVKSVRKKWLVERNFWGKLFSFQLKKIYLRLDGPQGDKGHLWTIIYDQNISHRNNTSFIVKKKFLNGGFDNENI